MQIIDNKALLLRLRDPDKVINAIPKSKAVGNNQVVVNWGLEEARSLNRLGIKSPSPIEAKYTWTGRYKPFDHQVSTASFLTLHQKGFCFNEQGTGKSKCHMGIRLSYETRRDKQSACSMPALDHG